MHYVVPENNYPNSPKKEMEVPGEEGGRGGRGVLQLHQKIQKLYEA